MTDINSIIYKCQQGLPLQWEEYVAGARRTAVADRFYDSQYRLETAVRLLNKFVNIGQEIDKLKKAIFYGKNVKEVFGEHYVLKDGYPPLPEDYKWNSAVTFDEIHGILGVATEAVELVELLVSSLAENKPLDRVNLHEELGDIFWYIALLNIDYNSVLTKNLLKLHVRYPEKFTEDSAINRDLDKELEVLQTNPGEQK